MIKIGVTKGSAWITARLGRVRLSVEGWVDNGSPNKYYDMMEKMEEEKQVIMSQLLYYAPTTIEDILFLRSEPDDA